MKKIFLTVIALMMTLGLSGCKNESEQEKVINSFFEYMQEAQFSKIKKLATKDAKGVDEYVNFGYEFFGFEYKDSNVFDDFLKVLTQQIYESYEIENEEEKDAQYIIEVKVTGKDVENVTLQNQKELQNKVMEYADDHQEELIDLYQLEGQEAMYTKMYEQILPSMTEAIKDSSNDQKTQEETLKFVLIEEKDQWLIDQIS